MAIFKQRQWTISHKISAVIFLLLFLVIDLIGLNIVTIRDVSNQTNHITNVTLPRLALIRTITDSLNQAVVVSYDYAVTGDASKQAVVDTLLTQTVTSQVQLFELADTTVDFEFSKQLEEQTNQIADTIHQLFADTNSATTQQRLSTLAITWSQFRTFVNTQTSASVERYRQDTADTTASVTQRNWWVGGTVVLIALLIALITIQALRRWITRPIQELTKTADSMSQGQFRFVDITSHDEFGLLADTFNTMAQRMKATQESLSIELARAQNLDHQKTEFVSIAAHQLRTPMSGIKWMVDMAVQGDFGKIDPEVKTQLFIGRHSN